MGRHRYAERLAGDHHADRPHRYWLAARGANHRRLSADRTTIAFAERIEREFGGFTPPPMLQRSNYSAAQ